MNTPDELSRAILVAFRKPDYLGALFPNLFQTGIHEGSIHPFMVSALLLLGSQFGFSPVCDSPVFERLDNLLTGEGNKRPDSVWYERGTENINVLIEFEHYKPNALEHKARNLLLMNNACRPAPQLLSLIYWSYNVLPATALIGPVSIFRSGYTVYGNKFYPAECPVLIAEIVVSKQNGKTRLETAIARAFVHQGEDKKYMLDLLNKA